MIYRPAYFDRYETVAFDRSEDGVLVVRLHRDDGPVRYGSQDHSEWTPAFGDVAGDRDNRVVIITGTGDVFIDRHHAWEEPLELPRDYDIAGQRQKLLYDRLLEIDVPVIGVVNGPVTMHAEVVLLGDITLAASHAVFADEAHFPHGEPANDGGHVLWPELLGLNRAKYFLMTGLRIGAAEAARIGFVNEVWPLAQLMPRALELAHQLATYNDMALRFQRRAFTDRWKHLFLDRYGAGFGMATEALYWMDQGKNPWVADGDGGSAKRDPITPVQAKRHGMNQADI